ncbi:carboxylesterase family protein [Actinomycetes bacterium KLBMP 9797]
MAHRRLRTGATTLLVGEDGGLLRARGVRYGTAERFAPPRPPDAQPGVVDATRPGPICPQLPSRLASVTGPGVEGLTASEDCLVLSVTAPAGASGLPVMVWFHGGAYMTGGGEQRRYDPGPLVREGGVVVVNVTYRLGVFGYLTPDPFPDNLGLRDQILALRWVRDHIAAFGGDPGNVTAFGQSAGADSVLSLMLCAEADGLFRRAIMQSAPLGLRDKRDAMTAAMRRASAAAAAPGATVEQVLAAQAAATVAAQRFGVLGGLPFAPILGQAPLPSLAEVPARLAGAAARVELLIGYTKDDAAPFVALNRRAAAVGRLGPPGRAAIRSVVAAATRRVFGDPVRRLARTWGDAVATYRFDWTPADGPFGACHCIELPFLLGTPETWARAPMLGSGGIDRELALRLRACWAGFAHDGLAALPTRTRPSPSTGRPTLIYTYLAHALIMGSHVRRA